MCGPASRRFCLQLKASDREGYETVFCYLLSLEQSDTMTRTATLAVGQYQCTVGDKDANLARIEQLTREAAQQGAQLVCFPEMGTTGFAGELLHDSAEPIPGPSVQLLGDIARH